MVSTKVPAAEGFMRMSGTADWTEAVADGPCEKAGVEDLYDMLRRFNVKRQYPVLWLMTVRSALNLSKSPNAALSLQVLKKWPSALEDREMHGYLEVDRRFGVLSQYEPHSGSRVGAIMARF
jgi:hypothetical protein